MTLPLPAAALSQHVIILGKTGAGKSSAMRLIVESLLDEVKPVCIIDPKGDWWGLKSSATGKSAGYPVIIFGGEHADVPLNAHAGSHVAELVATGNRPCIIDLGGWTVRDRTRFFIDFAGTLFRHTRGPRHLVIDEIHNFAPQGKIMDPEAGQMLHWANRLASEGRGKGITLISASQRPQKVHKDFVTSNETLIAMRVIHPLDRNAIKDWIDGCPDRDKGSEVLNTLASMPRGEGWVWSPEIGFGPERIKFPKFATYDSFAAPTGDGTAKLKGWAAVDLDEVKAKLAAVVEVAKENDPKLLKAEITRLKREIAQRDAARPAQADQAAIEDAHKRGFAAGVIEHKNRLVGVFGELENRWKNYRLSGEELTAAITRILEAAQVDLGYRAPPPSGPIVRTTARKPPPAAAPPRESKPTNGAASPLTNPQRKILASLAFWQSVGHETPSRPMVAAVAGYTPSAGRFNNLIGELRTAGLIDIPMAGRLSLTADGGAHTDGIMAASEAREFIRSVLDAPQRKLVEAAMDVAEITREDLAARTDYAPGAGRFNNLIGSLCTIDIFTKPRPGSVAVTDWARKVL